MADVYEQNLAQKTTVTDSDYLRIVGSDNVSYKNTIDRVKNAMNLTGFKSYNGLQVTQLDDTTYAGIGAFLSSAMAEANNRNKWLTLRTNAGTTKGAPFYNSSFSILANCSSANYGFAILQSDYEAGSGFVIGRLWAGTWTWRNIPAELDALASDSGWIELKTGVKYRKVGNICYVNIEGYTATQTSGTETIGTLPTGYRPTGVNIQWTARKGTNTLTAGWLTPGGTINYTAVSASGSLAGFITFPVG